MSLQNGSDLRGVAMEGMDGQEISLTEEAAADLTFGFLTWLSEKTKKSMPELTVAVGRDSRLSGPALMSAVISTASRMGVSVLDCSMASTPAMYMATVFSATQADGSMMITASHLPYNRNGFKYFTREGGLESTDIKSVVKLAEKAEHSGLASCGEKVSSAPLMELYSAHLREIILKSIGSAAADKPLKGLHVVCDAGNGAGGFYARDVLEPLGADIAGSQFLEPDGWFPNHQPNPENKEAMRSISAAAAVSKADIGLIFDTDVDRSAAVDSHGKAISRNRIVALAAALIAEDYPGTTVVTDSVTSDQLTEFLEGGLGLKHLRYQRGYRNVINKAIQLNTLGTDCQLAIETSGHAAFKENYFLDDGAYLATKIVVRAAMLKKEGKGIDCLLEGLGEPLEAVEVRLPVLAENFPIYADQILKELKEWIDLGECSEDLPCAGRCRCGMKTAAPNYEGIRVSLDAANGDGWFLLRKSLHEPLMPLNIESNQKGGCKMIAAKVVKLLEKYNGLDLSALEELI
jgi:phosphomannomutase